jgi:hypothetical protein
MSYVSSICTLLKNSVDLNGWYRTIADTVSNCLNSSIYEPKTRDHDPILNALIVFDYRQSDRNGAMIRRIGDALEEKIPIFCSVNMLKGIANDPLLEAEYGKSDASDAKAHIRSLLEKQSKEWDLFIDIQNNGQLFILPKSYYGSYRLEEKLNILGINPIQVRSISFQELENIVCEPGLDDFFSLFYPGSKVRLRFFLAGHGGETSIAGLDFLNYKKFLDGLNRLNCDVLFSQSCLMGGTNKEHQAVTKFPIVLFSIGKLPTFYQKCNYKSFFIKIDQMLQQPVQLTKEVFARALKKNGWSERWENLAQLRLPEEREFRPLNEDGSAYLIENDSSDPNRELRIDHTRLLQFCSERAPQLIYLGNEAPIFLSMKHDRPFHIIAKMSTVLSLDDLLQETKLLSEEKKAVDFSQTIVFQQLQCKDHEYAQVVFICDRGKTKLLAYDSSQKTYIHFRMFDPFGAIFPDPISESEYFVILKESMSESEIKEIVAKT